MRLDGLSGQLVNKGIIDERQAANNEFIVEDGLKRISGVRDVFLIYDEGIEPSVKFDRFQILTE